MFLVHVHVRVKPECVDAFKQATVINARESNKEPGIFRFDFLQQQDDPSRFVLIEGYRNDEASAAHKVTPHYQVWRDTVVSMMAEPRVSTKFHAIFPEIRA
jgi:(4S)-4-hydroxy-5-phosphonooxypentane-2,3-dione isomerase